MSRLRGCPYPDERVRPFIREVKVAEVKQHCLQYADLWPAHPLCLLQGQLRAFPECFRPLGDLGDGIARKSIFHGGCWERADAVRKHL